MTKLCFPNGGYVVHGVRNIVNSAKISAWFDAYGNMVDCAYYRDDSPGVERNIPHSWRHVRRSIQCLYGNLEPPVDYTVYHETGEGWTFARKGDVMPLRYNYFETRAAAIESAWYDKGKGVIKP